MIRESRRWLRIGVAVKAMIWTTLILTQYLAARAAEAPAEKKFFDSNGVRIRYIDEGQGEPLLLIHGFTANIQAQWSSVLPALKTQFRVIALDNRGHGESDKPHDPEKYGAEMAEDSIRLLDHLGVEKAHVAGYSMGGFITMKLLATHPDRFQSAIVAGAGWGRTDDERFIRIQELADSLDRGEGFGPLFIGLTPPGEPTPTAEQIKQVSAMVGTFNDLKALACVARGMLGLMVTEEQVRANKVPTLLLIGTRDPLKANTDALVGVMPRIETSFIEGADHMNCFRRPEFLQSMTDFLNRHRMEPATAPAAVPAGN